MNKRQKAVLIIGVGIIVVLVLFPPWYVQGKDEYRHMKFHYGYRFISSPPCCAPHIDYPKLIWPIAVVCFMMLLAFLEFASPR